MRSALSHCTVLCIAHRLQTVVYYDRVLVLDRGEVKEYDDPYTLLQQEESLFYRMCRTSPVFDELLATAQQAYEQRLHQ